MAKEKTPLQPVWIAWFDHRGQLSCDQFTPSHRSANQLRFAKAEQAYGYRTHVHPTEVHDSKRKALVALRKSLDYQREMLAAKVELLEDQMDMVKEQILAPKENP